jgi:hypothetical protein
LSSSACASSVLHDPADVTDRAAAVVSMTLVAKTTR